MFAPTKYLKWDVVLNWRVMLSTELDGLQVPAVSVQYIVLP